MKEEKKTYAETKVRKNNLQNKNNNPDKTVPHFLELVTYGAAMYLIYFFRLFYI